MNKNDFIKDFKKKFPTTSSFSSGFAMFIVDAIVLFLCIGIGFFIINLIIRDDINFKSFVGYSIYIPLILIVFSTTGLYPGIMIPPADEVKKFTFGTFISFSAIILSIFISSMKDFKFTQMIVKNSEDIAVTFAFIISFFFAIILLPSCREIVKHLLRNHKWWGVPAVIYCSDDSGEIIINRLIKNSYLGYHPAIIINNNITEPAMFNDIPVYPDTPEVLSLIRELNIKTAFLCDYHGDTSLIMSSYRYTITVSKAQTNFTSTQHLKDIAGIIGFASTHNLTFKSNLFFKRILDIFLVLLASPLLIPVMLILIILTKCTSKGPVFYGHRRVGKNGKEFKCWKFRSMCIDADKQLEKILAEHPEMREEWERDRKFENDPRVTKFGKILRKTSLDELPQVFNIITGEMSFVGPRPVTESEMERYGKYKDYVLSVSPGLTGMWQVSGRSDTGYEERISFDTYYIQNWSIWLDIWIMIKTVWVVIKGKGAY